MHAAQPRHLDVEKEQFGFFSAHKSQGLLPVSRLAHQAHSIVFACPPGDDINRVNALQADNHIIQHATADRNLVKYLALVRDRQRVEFRMKNAPRPTACRASVMLRLRYVEAIPAKSEGHAGNLMALVVSGEEAAAFTGHAD